MQADIEARLKKVFCEKIPTISSMDIIQPDSEMKVLGVNSMSYVQLVIDIEKEFSVEFDLDGLDVNNFKKFKDLVLYMEKNFAD